LRFRWFRVRHDSRVRVSFLRSGAFVGLEALILLFLFFSETGLSDFSTCGLIPKQARSCLTSIPFHRLSEICAVPFDLLSGTGIVFRLKSVKKLVVCGAAMHESFGGDAGCSTNCLWRNRRFRPFFGPLWFDRRPAPSREATVFVDSSSKRARRRQLHSAPVADAPDLLWTFRLLPAQLEAPSSHALLMVPLPAGDPAQLSPFGSSSARAGLGFTRLIVGVRTLHLCRKCLCVREYSFRKYLRSRGTAHQLSYDEMRWRRSLFILPRLT